MVNTDKGQDTNVTGDQGQDTDVTSEASKKAGSSNETASDQVTLTKAELEQLLQSHTDKRVSEAIKSREDNLRSQIEKDAAERLRDQIRKELALADAQKNQDIKAEVKLLREELEKRDSEAKQAKLSAYTNRLIAENNLGQFASVFERANIQSEDQALSLAESLQASLGPVVEAKVNERIHTPTAVQSTAKKVDTSGPVNTDRMSVDELQAWEESRNIPQKALVSDKVTRLLEERSQSKHRS